MGGSKMVMASWGSSGWVGVWARAGVSWWAGMMQTYGSCGQRDLGSRFGSRQRSHRNIVENRNSGVLRTCIRGYYEA